jgi:2-polyprenyl-3-methyl-5-hydroxy-6-metoxy-1,4-benzoquinol methylase
VGFVKPPVFNPDWPDDVKVIYAHDMEEEWDRRRASHLWNKHQDSVRRYLEVVRAHGRPLRILDVGCAQGTLALRLAEEGHDVVAVDIRPQFLQYAAAHYEHGRVRFIEGDALTLELHETFDLVFANQILEHLVFPVAFVARLRGWLREGGELVMTTPNGEYVKSGLPHFSQIGDPAAHAGRQYSADGDGHFFAYTAAELAAIVKQAGLSRVTVRFFQSPWMTGHMKFRWLHSLVPVTVLARLDRATLAVPFAARRLGYQLMVQGASI